MKKLIPIIITLLLLLDGCCKRRPEWYESARVTVLGCNIGNPGEWYADVEQQTTPTTGIRRSLRITDQAVASAMMVAVVEGVPVNVKLQVIGDWETAVGFCR